MEDKNNENIPYINNTTNNKDYLNNYSSQKNGCGIGNILLNIIVTIIVVFTIDYIKSRKSNLENTYTESIVENYEIENEYTNEEPEVEDYEVTTEYSDEEPIVEDYEATTDYSDEEPIVEDYEIENEEENKTEKEIIIENNIENLPKKIENYISAQILDFEMSGMPNVFTDCYKKNIRKNFQEALKTKTFTPYENRYGDEAALRQMERVSFILDIHLITMDYCTDATSKLSPDEIKTTF